MNTNTPHILGENAQGITEYRIIDRMFANREVLLYGEVDRDQVASLTVQLMCLAKEDPSAPITMYVNSPGGSCAEGMALFDVMKAIPCPVHTVCTGLAASMAALIFAVGDHRKMLPHSKVMVHEPFTPQASGNMFDMENYASNLKQLREEYCRIMAERCGKTLEEVYEAIHKETYFTMDEAIAFGLCDAAADRL